VFVLVVDGAPARWSSGFVSPRVEATATGETLNFTTAASGHFLRQGMSGGSFNSETRTYGASIWLKAGTVRRVNLQLTNNSTASTLTTFYLTDDWREYFISVSGSFNGSSLYPVFSILNVGTDSGTVYIAKGQVEDCTAKGAFRTLYEATTSSVGRRNILLQSETIGTSPWTVSSGAVTITANTVSGPSSLFHTNLTPMLPGSLDVMEWGGSQSNLLEGSYSIGEMKVRLLDTARMATLWQGTELVGGTGRWLGQRAELYLGEAELTEDEYALVGSGYVSEVSLDGGTYEVSMLSRIWALDTEVMTNCWSVDCKVSDDLDDTVAPFQNFDVVGDELKAKQNYYNGVKLKFTSGKNNGSPESTISQYNVSGFRKSIVLTATANKMIKQGDELTIYNYVRMVGNPINIMMRILIDDFATAGTIQSNFPLTSISGVTPTGLSAFSIADFDVAGIQAMRDTWSKDTVFDITFPEPISAREFIEKQIMQLLGGFLVESLDGIFSLLISRPSKPASGAVTIQDQHTQGLPQWLRDTANIVTKITVQGNYNAATNKYSDLVTAESWDTRYYATNLNISRSLEISSMGLIDAYDGEMLATITIGAIMSRYGTGGPERITIKGGPILMFLKAGEKVYVSLTNVPSIAAGVMGKASEIFEVVSVKTSGSPLLTTLVLQGYTTSWRPAFIAPDADHADYVNATATEKQNDAYLYDSGTTFSDSLPPYVVS